MKVNLSQPVLNFNGDSIKEGGKELIMGKALANTIATLEARDNTAMQQYELARKLYTAEGEIEISESEREIIRKVCSNGRMWVIVAAQILNVVNNAK